VEGGESSHPTWLRKLLGRVGVISAFVWGIAEGAFFFIVPDLIVTLAALFNSRKALVHIFAVTIGSVLAGTALFAWASTDSERAIDVVQSVPFVTTEMAERVSDDFEQHGVWALLLGPTSGIPYKLYAVTAPAHVSYAAFVLVTVPARLERLIITWAIFSVLGIALGKWMRREPGLGLGLHAVYWIVVYAFYWGVL